MKHVRLPAYDASDLDRLSYSNGDLVNDTTNMTVRYMDGETPGGFKLATQNYVQTNAITSGNLATNLATALQPYALTADLAPYALTDDVNSAIAAIPIYSLPIAGNSSGSLGGVKVDGTTILINPTTGVISGANQYVLPTATVGTAGTGTLGGVKVDGTTILINNGVISGANQYVLPTATTSVKGGVTIPAVATSGLNNTSGAISLATASTTQLGGVKVDGSTITINGSGVISGAQLYTLPTATTTILGGVTVPATANSGLTNTSGAIRLATATTTQLGGIKVDGVTITINGSGVISANITGAIVFQGGWDASINSPTLNNASSAYNTNGFEFVCTKSGTVNFGAGNVTFAVGDNVIYDGTVWVKIPIGSSAGTTNSLLTFDNTGSGSASGTQFNGSAPYTISYNTLGASPLAGSSSLTTLGTVATGTWNGSIIGTAYGGTGVNNSFTLTISGANRTLDQNVTSGSSPNFVGTNFTGTAASLTAGNATAAGSATTAGRATNISGGANLRIPFNTAADTTSFIAAPSVDSTYLKYTTAGGIAFGGVDLATAATNLAGGAANRIAVQTGAGATGFVVAPTVASTFLTWTGSAFAFSTVPGASGGTVTSITASTTAINGLSLSGGTITTSGTIGLSGTLSLAVAPSIGSTTPNTGAFTTLTATSANVNVNLSPTGTGIVTINPASAGSINNMSIGATTRGSGSFTTLDANNAVGLSPGNQNVTISPTGTGSVTINPATAGTINNMSVGATTAATGRFTTVVSTTSIKSSGSGGVGYSTAAGAGGTVTQLVSRTTAVTINNITGQITLFTAAGDNTQWLSFTVNNSTVAATDVVIVTGDVVTNRYLANVTNVAAGSFEITFYSFGLSIDSPTFNFAVIKGSAN